MPAPSRRTTPMQTGAGAAADTPDSSAARSRSGGASTLPRASRYSERSTSGMADTAGEVIDSMVRVKICWKSSARNWSDGCRTSSPAPGCSGPRSARVHSETSPASIK